MKKSQILKLIKQGEGLNVEFKASLSDPERIAEIASSFANAKGGIVLIGVSDDSEIKGIEIGRKTIERLTDILVDNSDPKIYPEIKHRIIQGKDLISVSVKESPDKPHLAFGKAFVRIGKNTKPMSRGEYEKLLIEKNKENLQFDRQIYKKASLKDIDQEKLRWFLDEAEAQRGLKTSKHTKLKDALRRLRLLQNNKITNAAMLLFGRNPKFIQSEIKCIRFKGNKPIKPYIDFRNLEGNLFDLVDQALDFVLRNIKKAVWLVPGKVQREEKYEYPADAVREAIVNAVVHRDYFSPANVQVRVFDDYIEIWNPGELPKGWTVDRLKQKHESVPRNPLLFKQFFWVKYVEDVGGGTLDIIQECKKWGLAEPEFEFTGTSIVVAIKKLMISEEYLEGLELNPRQKQAIEHLKEHKNISTKEYMRINQVSDKTAFLELKNLAEKNVLVRRGRGRAVIYCLKDND